MVITWVLFVFKFFWPAAFLYLMFNRVLQFFKELDTVAVMQFLVLYLMD